MSGLFGGGKKKAAEPVAKPVETPAPEVKPAAQTASEEQAARRRARRAGRPLLSESRLNPEQGMQQTLGAGPMQ